MILTYRKIFHHHIGHSAPLLSQVVKSKLNFRRWCVLRKWADENYKGSGFTRLKNCTVWNFILHLWHQWPNAWDNHVGDWCKSGNVTGGMSVYIISYSMRIWTGIEFFFWVNYRSSLKTPLCMLLFWFFSRSWSQCIYSAWVAGPLCTLLLFLYWMNHNKDTGRDLLLHRGEIQ